MILTPPPPIGDATIWLKDLSPSQNVAATSAADVKPTSHAGPGIRVTSQAPSKQMAPSAGT